VNVQKLELAARLGDLERELGHVLERVARLEATATVREKCRRCDGTGHLADPDPVVPCPQCGGTGWTVA